MTQLTFGTPLPGRYIHGAQIVGERSGIDDGYDASLVYVGALRFSERWSLSRLQGAKYGAGISDRERGYWSWLGNATAFAEARRGYDWRRSGTERGNPTELRGASSDTDVAARPALVTSSGTRV